MTSGRSGPDRSKRQRVVLAHRRGTRVVRTRVEIEEQTEVGDALVRGLVRAQLGLAMRLAVFSFGALAAIALISSSFPALGAAMVFGIRLNWLTLGVLVYPALYSVGRLFIRLAEQSERDFIRVIDAGEEQ